MRVLLIFCIILLMLMCGAVGRLFAEAPTTPKILFTSARHGNREIYIMNPNGSEQVRLTDHPANDLTRRLVSNRRADSVHLRSRR